MLSLFGVTFQGCACAAIADCVVLHVTVQASLKFSCRTRTDPVLVIDTPTTNTISNIQCPASLLPWRGSTLISCCVALPTRCPSSEYLCLQWHISGYTPGFATPIRSRMLSDTHNAYCRPDAGHSTSKYPCRAFPPPECQSRPSPLLKKGRLHLHLAPLECRLT